MALSAPAAGISDRTCAYARWLGEVWIVFGTALVVLAAVVIAFWPPITEQRMRLSGFVLQLIGIGFGIPALVKTRRLFYLPSFAESVRDWLKRRPRYKHDVSLAVEGLKLKATLGVVKASGWSGMGPELGITQRIASLVENIERLRTQIGESNEEHRDSIAQLRTEIEGSLQGTEAKLSEEARSFTNRKRVGLRSRWQR